MAKHYSTEPIRLMIEEVWNKGRVELLPELYQPDARVYLNEGYIEGYDRLRDEFILPTLQAFPDMKHTIDEFIGEGDRVAMRYKGSGTHRGEFGGKAATGNVLKYEGIIVFHLSNSKIQEVWNHSNWPDAFAAL